MMKAIFVLLLFVLTFGAGYYVGSSGTKEIKRNYSSLKDEMSAKTRGLEAEVSSMRVRMNLVEAREYLGSANAAVKEKNFGEAGTEIDKVKERLAKAASLGSDSLKKSLSPIQSEVGSIEEEVRRLNPKVAPRIEAMEKELERITG